MKASHDDVLDLFDHVWQRFTERMAGLGDDEWRWHPSPDDRITLRWRLAHIAQLLRRERNGPWLGLPAGPAEPARLALDSAAAARADLDDAFAQWRGQLAAVSEDAFAQPIGPVADRYGAATRRSFALHIADELVHHTAEAALLRDLYPGHAAHPR